MENYDLIMLALLGAATLFGAYKGSVRRSGFHWTNPFNRKIRISLRKQSILPSQ